MPALLGPVLFFVWVLIVAAGVTVGSFWFEVETDFSNFSKDEPALVLFSFSVVVTVWIALISFPVFFWKEIKSIPKKIKLKTVAASILILFFFVPTLSFAGEEEVLDAKRSLLTQNVISMSILKLAVMAKTNEETLLKMISKIQSNDLLVRNVDDCISGRYKVDDCQETFDAVIKKASGK